MASTNRSLETIASIEPSQSSSLLGWTNSASSYTGERNRRPVTPADEIIREVWYNTLRSTFHGEWANIRELFDGSWCLKLEAVLKCLWLPFYVLIHALNGRRRYFRQNGIMYLYVYLGVTVVVNLMVALKINASLTEGIQKGLVILSMLIAIGMMLYLLMSEYRRATFPRSRGTWLRIFYEGGLFFFGLFSFGYSIGVAIKYVSCQSKYHILNAEVTGIKAMFTFLQTVFFHCFYRARIPKDAPYIEFILAHLLGTNLALWFWILCAEAAENPEECIGRVEKYISPFFVEFLLLGASLFYQIWKDLKSENTTLFLAQYRCTCNECQSTLYHDLLARNDGDSQSENSSNTSSPNEGLKSLYPGLFIGGSFAALFVVLILFSTLSSSDKQGYHIAYSVGTIILHLAQICACYICQLSLQFHQRDPERYQGNPERLVLDHEDILLYFSLAGIVLWIGFHAYTLMLSGFDHVSDLVADMVDILHVLFQTATLINLRSHKQTPGQSQVWIRECLLFLLVTNLVLWVEDSFFIEVAITRPGERYLTIQHNELRTIGYVVHPIDIFYRFHSSVCCVLALYVFKVN